MFWVFSQNLFLHFWVIQFENPNEMIQSILIGFLLFLPALLSAQTPQAFVHHPEKGAPMDLAEFMAASHVQGLSMVVMTGLETDTCITMGYADVEKEIRVAPETRFQVGSMGTALTHFLVLRSVELGKLKLDAPAQDYLRSWQLPKKGFAVKDPVTVRDLLLQRRKFNWGSKPDGYLPGAPLPNLQQILNGESPAQHAPVVLEKSINKSGNSSYANAMVLQQVLEDVWGEPLDELIRREVLAPLDMQHSFFGSIGDAQDRPEFSVGYELDGSPIEGRRRVFPELAVAGLWTTPGDYAKFVVHVFQAAAGVDNRLISQSLAQQATTPQLNNRSLIFYKGYDLYWGGAPPGFYCTFQGKPENGTVVIVFTNSSVNWRFTNTALGMGWDFARSLTDHSEQ